MTVEPVGPMPKRERRLPPLDDVLPDPVVKVSAEPFAIHMMGIGGTGVVTVNQILGTAALLDGRHVRGLDQTGLSQKGGPVVSDLKVSGAPIELANKVSAGGADCYLGFDLLVASEPGNLDKADPGRTIAVVSTSQIPTGQMVVDPGAHYPELGGLLLGIDRVSRKDDNVYLDAQGIAEALFNDHMAQNLIMLGAAYQAGALPISAGAIEQAVRLNGVSVEMNLLSFRWGRLAVLDPQRVEAAVRTATQKDVAPACAVGGGPPAGGLGGRDGETRRLLEVRVPGPDRLPERGLRGLVRGVRGAGRAGGARAHAGRERARGGGRPVPAQADGVQGRVRGRAAAPRPRVPGRDRGGDGARGAAHVAAAPAAAARARRQEEAGARASGSRPPFACCGPCGRCAGPRSTCSATRRCGGPSGR